MVDVRGAEGWMGGHFPCSPFSSSNDSEHLEGTGVKKKLIVAV